MKARITESKMARERYVELRRILEERRREILSEVQEKMRDVRAEGASGEGKGVLDAAETSEADIQDDIEFALIQMKSETLHKIEEALARLDEGTLRVLLRVRRRDFRAAPPGVALRGPVQGLRGSPGNCGAARAHPVAAPRRRIPARLELESASFTPPCRLRRGWRLRGVPPASTRRHRGDLPAGRLAAHVTREATFMSDTTTSRPDGRG